MAQIFPSDIWDRYKAAAPSLSPGHDAEFQTLRWLEKALPDDLSIFYSLSWAFEDGRRLHSREVDFIIANRRGQCLLIEQKLGKLDETPHGLQKSYGDSQKDVVQQITDSIDGLKANYRSCNSDTPPLKIGYLLYCPDHKIIDANAAGLVPDCIIDARRRQSFPKEIAKRLSDGSKDWTDEGVVCSSS